MSRMKWKKDGKSYIGIDGVTKHTLSLYRKYGIWLVSILGGPSKELPDLTVIGAKRQATRFLRENAGRVSAPTLAEQSTEASKNVVAAADAEEVRFEIVGRVSLSGMSTADAVEEIKGALESIRGFAEAEASLTVPGKFKI